MPAARLVLYGASSPKVSPTFWKDPDPIIFSEIVEFALSLTPPAKGQEAFPGIPHLQAYKLIRAANLTELGHIELANRSAAVYAYSPIFSVLTVPIGIAKLSRVPSTVALHI